MRLYLWAGLLTYRQRRQAISHGACLLPAIRNCGQVVAHGAWVARDSDKVVKEEQSGVRWFKEWKCQEKDGREEVVG